jgi:hypothetical protein
MADQKKYKGGFKWWLRRLFNSSFDNRLEDFVLSLLEIEGMKEVLSDFGRGRLIAFQIRTIVELSSLKAMLLKKYIPDARESADKLRKQAGRSKYRDHLSKVNFDEGVHEVIRLGYVNAFHKLESYRDELIGLVNERGRELYGRQVDIADYLKRVHKFKVDDLNKYPETVRRINWICNCVKHYSGYPRRKNPPVSCQGMDTTKKIVLSKEDLGREIDFLIQFTSRLFKLAMLAVACVHLEDIFDNSDSAKQRELGPSVILLATVVVVYIHSLKDESDEDVAKKWESFVNHWALMRTSLQPPKL